MTSRLFDINLSIHREMYAGALRLVLMLLSLTFIGLLAWDVQRLQDVQAMTARGEQALVRAAEQDRRMQVEGRADGLDLSDAALQRLPRDVAFANQLIAKRAFSWTHFLGDLEEAIPTGVSINSIRLDPKESIIALTGSAASLKNLTTLIISLEDYAAFHDAVLLQHRVQDNTLVDFNVSVHYTDVTGSQPPSPTLKNTHSMVLR
jgi:Tfp pilus assembly protein PilN